MTTATLTLPYRFIMKNERSLAAVFGVLAIIGIGMYIYGVIGTTIAITERRHLENEVRLANTRISELEIAYFNTIGSVTVDRAKELGFHEVKDIAFAYSNTTSAVALAPKGH